MLPQIDGIDLLTNFPDLAQESTAFVSIILPDHTRIFNWFTGTKPAESIYDFVKESLPDETKRFVLVDRDLPEAEDRIDPNLSIGKSFHHIYQGSNRSRYRLAVRFPTDA